MSLTDTFIAANERSERHALGRGKRRVPARAMLHRRHGVTARVLRVASRLMADQRLAGDRMLALGKPFELVFAHVADEPPPLGELAVPDAANHIALRVVVVAGVLKLLGVIAACLSRAERLRDREHCIRYWKNGCCSTAGDGGRSCAINASGTGD